MSGAALSARLLSMLSDKLYFRLLSFFTAVFALSQAGLAFYFLTPRKQPPPAKFYRMPEISSPTFKYGYRAEAEEGGVVEVEVPAATARKILQLLRHAKTYNATLDEYLAKHPEETRRYRHFYPEFLGWLEVYENGSEMPTLVITFLHSDLFWSSRPVDYETYVIPPQNRGELSALLETLDPRLKEAREIEESARNKEL